MYKVSIIIPARNEERFLPECLKSVQAQTYPHHLLEIILVNSNSSDGTENVMKNFSLETDIPAVKILQNPNGDTPGALNVGYKNATGDLFLHIIAHVSIESDHIERAVMMLDEKKADGICGRILTIGSGENSFWDDSISTAMESLFGIGNAWARVRTKEGWIDNPMIALYKRELLEKFGYINNRLTRNQDYEFNQRCFAGGAKFWFEPSLKVYYRNRARLGQLWRQYFNAAKWRTFMIGEHNASVRLRHLVPPLFVLSLLISAIVSLFWQPACFVFASIIGLYAIGLLLNTILNAFKRKKILILITLPCVFATIHFAYGLGFFTGLFCFFLLGKKKRIIIAESQIR